MKKYINTTLISMLCAISFTTLQAGYYEQQLNTAAELDCLTNAEDAIAHGATNRDEALNLAEYYNSDDVKNYLRELKAEEQADQDDVLIKDIEKTNPRVTRAARKAGTFLS